MAKLRKAVAYRRVERPYTRKSKKRELSYVRGAPYPKIVMFDMGNLRAKFPYKITLVSKNPVQIRDNALESARIAVNKVLTNTVGDANYYMKVKLFPHHILRENATAAGAGADRFSTGMAHSFGKPIGLAAQVRKGQELFVVYTEKQNIDKAKLALKQALYKFPTKGGYITVSEVK